MAFLLLGVSAILFTSAHTAQSDDTADLRPSWGSGQYQLPPNASILFSNHNPAFEGPTALNLNALIPQRKADELRQNYEDRNRDYEMRQNYGIVGYTDEMNHVQAAKDLGHDLLSAARNAELNPYRHNLVQANKTGEFSEPVSVVGGIAAFGMGTPIGFSLSDDVKGAWTGDLKQKHGHLDVKASDMTATVDLDANSGTVEKYLVVVNKPLALNMNTSVTYGGSSNTVNAALSRPIVDRLSGSVGATVPAGASPTGTPAQETVALQYGLTF